MVLGPPRLCFRQGLLLNKHTSVVAVDERPDVDQRQVITDGGVMDSSGSRQFRTACEHLGLSKGRSKQTCVERLRRQVHKLVAAHSVKKRFKDDASRPVQG